MLLRLFDSNVIDCSTCVREPWIVRSTSDAGWRSEFDTPFDMLVLNDIDRFHLVMDVIDRVPSLGAGAAAVKQLMIDKLTEHARYIRAHGEDMPEIQRWKWPGASRS